MDDAVAALRERSSAAADLAIAQPNGSHRAGLFAYALALSDAADFIGGGPWRAFPGERFLRVISERDAEP